MKPLRILYVSGTKGYAAGNRVMVSWIDHLLAKNFDIFVACPGGGALSQEIEKRLPSGNIIYSSFSFPSIKNPLFIVNLLRLTSFVSKRKPHIIHCNGEDIYVTMRYIAKLLKIPIIIHLRFHWSTSFYKWLFKDKYHPDLILTVSDSLKEEEIPKLEGVVDTSKVFTLHNTIDINLVRNLAQRQKFKFDKKSKYILGIAAPIQERKGQVYAFDLANELLQRNIDFSLLLAGSVKEESYYEKCLNYLNEHKNVRNRVFFLGFVKEIFSFMSFCDLMLTFSSYETFGMTVLESMAIGTPIVGFSVPAINEVLGRDDLTVPKGDLDSLTEITFKLLRDENYRKDISRYLENRSSFFTPERIVPKLTSYYNNIV